MTMRSEPLLEKVNNDSVWQMMARLAQGSVPSLILEESIQLLSTHWHETWHLMTMRSKAHNLCWVNHDSVWQMMARLAQWSVPSLSPFKREETKWDHALQRYIFSTVYSC